MSKQTSLIFSLLLSARPGETQPGRPRGDDEGRHAGGDLGQEVLQGGRSDVGLREDFPPTVPGWRWSGEHSESQTDHF